MKLLVDTHVFLWMDDTPERLSPAVREALLSNDVEVYLSVVSVWEIAIKQRLGKLKLSAPLSSAVKIHQDNNGFSILPVSLRHALAVETLIDHHKDPFDRLLIAQALTEDMTIASADKLFTSYPVPVLW